jgi:hypothetical protein
MKATSGLSEDCLRYLNQPLEIKFVAGWGWLVQKEFCKASIEFADMMKINGSISEITPRKFHRHHGVLRAFKGEITGIGHYFYGMEAFVFSRNDGFNWNFSDRSDSTWCIALGKGEPQFPCRTSPNPWPVIFKNDIIRGFCEYIRENKTEANQSLQTTTMAVTDRAPSSTLRASHGRV